MPTTLDMSRLVQKIAVRTVGANELPAHIAQTVAKGTHQYHLFGLKWSGQAVLDELHLARVFLYAKIYRHQKVLAIEAMIQAFLEAMGAIEGMTTEKLIEMTYQFSDDHLLWSDPRILLERVGLETKPCEAFKFLEDALSRLRDRRVFVNALSVRPQYPGDPWGDDKEQEKGLRKLDEDLRHPQNSQTFRKALVEEIRRLIGLLPNAAGDFDVDLLDYSVVVSAKPRLSGGTEIDRAFIFQGTKTVQYRDVTGVNRSGWVDAYSFSSTSVFIFAPRDIAPVVYVAAEALIRKNYNVVLPATTLELSKQSETLVSDLKRALEGVGYYKGLPFDIRPVPQRLFKADIDSAISGIAEKLQTIDEPTEQSGARRPKELRDRVRMWLSQFRTDEHVSYAIDLLRAIRVLDRADTKRALTQFLEKHPQFRGASIVTLGDVKDSSAIQQYYARDIPDAFGKVSSLVNVAKAQTDAHVVFLDDFVGSGGQVSDILGQWFGNEDLQNPDLNEQRELFGQIELEYLRSRKVGFVFVAGWSDGETKVAGVAAKLGLDATIYIDITDADIPFAFEKVLQGDRAKIEAFRQECQRIGEELLRSAGKGEDKVQTRSLGYGNRAMLLVSRYNVPTQVLSCLWMGGQVEGVDWQPLVHRRAKL